jgi:hypothetical protein
MRKFFGTLSTLIGCLWLLAASGMMIWDLYHIAVSWKIKGNILVDFVSIIFCILVAIILFIIFKEEVKDVSK